MIPQPPEIPKARFFTIGTYISILIMALAIAVIGKNVYFPAKEEVETEHQPDAPLTDIVFELQSKVTIGIAGWSPDAAKTQIEELIPMTNTPGAARAVTGLMLYTDPEEYKDQALQLLADNLADRKVDEVIRTALTNPEKVTDADQQLLIDQLNWTGRVLVAALDDSTKAEVEAEGMKLFSLIFIVGLVIAVAGLTGLILFVLGLTVKPKNRSRRFRFDPHCPQVGRIYFQAFACYLAGMVVIGAVFFQFLPDVGKFASVIIIGGAFLLGLIWPLLRGVQLTTMLRDLGIHRGQGLFKELGAGIVGYLAITPIICIGLVMTWVTSLIVNAVSKGGAAGPPKHPVFEWFSEPSWQIFAFALFVGSVVAPVTEEIMFRGALYRGLRFRFPAIGSAIVMAFIFAIVHPQGIVAVPGLMLVALGLTLLREWRDSVVAPIVAHGIHNGVVLSFASLLFAG